MTHDNHSIGTRAVVRTFFRLALTATVLPLAACNGPGPINTSVESVHQPVVSYTSYVYDVRIDGSRLSASEQDRLSGWLDSLNAAYGDKIAVATNGAYVPLNFQNDVAAVLNRRALSIGEDNSAAAGTPPAGTVRLILRRATASVPGCPNWITRQEGDMVGGTSSNYGCGVNSNLAAMVADPEDLVRGRTSDSSTLTTTSTRAIESYRKQEPTGAAGLKNLSAGGN